jgi:hypothetical protein
MGQYLPTVCECEVNGDEKRSGNNWDLGLHERWSLKVSAPQRLF